MIRSTVSSRGSQFLPLLSLAFLTVLILGCASSARELPPPGAGPQEVVISDYQGLYAFLEQQDYSQATWRQGRRDIPRVFFTQVPSRWREVVDQGLPVQDKKQLFYLSILPLVLRANELIEEERQFIETHYARHRFGQPLPMEDQERLEQIAAKYGYPMEQGQMLEGDDFSSLMQRIDIVPPSLALGQAAYESGYGTSRFAGLGNALFGQWTRSGGMRPQEQRTHLGDYGVAAFDSPLDSVVAYTVNLNTNKAYEGFRRERAMLRERGKHLSGAQLAGTLVSYSERGIAYTDSLRGLIMAHHLYEAEDAQLRDMAPIHLVPASSIAGGTGEG